MKIADIPHKMDFTFDDELHEVPLDKGEMKKGLRFLEGKLKEDGINELESAVIMTLIGQFSRILGGLAQSEEMLTKAFHIFKEKQQVTHAFNVKLKLAMTLLALGNKGKAQKITKGCLDYLSKSKDAKLSLFNDHIIHQLGRIAFAQRYYEQALNHFLKAHEIRILKGNVEHIQQTEHAISVTRQKLDEL